MSRPSIGITPGDPAGIGPDVCLLAWQVLAPEADLVFFSDPELLQARALVLGLDIDPGELNITSVASCTSTTAGVPDPRNADHIIDSLSVALSACRAGKIDAIVTGPVNKALVNDGGHPFTGHTEWFAEATNSSQPVMMLTANEFRVAVATTHLPLRKVPDAITRELLISTLRVMHSDLKSKFGIPDPIISVCGLNPHAGEEGKMGKEEITTISPVIESLKEEGMNLVGPLPADTAFTKRSLEGIDAVLAMYHDQGLSVLKHAAFGDAINITLGLPIIRTSVDHGTAYDLAGTGRADADSMIVAIRSAVALAARR